MINSYIKGVFWIVGMCLAAMLLYQLFFVGDNSAINYACRMVETPIAEAYYDEVLSPSILSSKGTVESLGGTVTQSSELALGHISGGKHSTGWK